jgi:hypothetical protein
MSSPLLRKVGAAMLVMAITSNDNIATIDKIAMAMVV